jgi:hypothetical protein
MAALHRGVHDRYDVIYLAVNTSAGRLQTYFASRPFDGRVLLLEPNTNDAVLEERFGVTPQLIVVDAKGIVQRAWVGAFYGPRLAEIDEYFSVALPGTPPAGTGETGRAR